MIAAAGAAGEAVRSEKDDAWILRTALVLANHVGAIRNPVFHFLHDDLVVGEHDDTKAHSVKLRGIEMIGSQIAVFALLCVALSFPLSAQWARVVFSEKGQSADIPAAHPLTYFTANPLLRDDGHEFCERCAPSDKSESGLKYAIRVTVKAVGVLAGFRIIDVLYAPNVRTIPSATATKWKSILVQVGPDRYKEIFHLQAFYTTASIGPTRIIQSGNEPVLATMDSDGGNGGGCWEGYWWFDSHGPHSLDFSPLAAAIRERLLAAHERDAKVQLSCSNLNLGSQQVKSGIQKSHAQCRACDLLGELTARFRLEGAVVQPITIDFNN